MGTLRTMYRADSAGGNLDSQLHTPMNPTENGSLRPPNRHVRDVRSIPRTRNVE